MTTTSTTANLVRNDTRDDGSAPPLAPQRCVLCPNPRRSGRVAFAPMRVSNARFASATLPCRAWRKGSFGPLSAGAPRSSRTPSTNVLRATCATSASDAAPSAIISAEPWVSAVLARTASSRSCSVICWIWRCSLYWTLRSSLIHRNRAPGRDMTPCSHRVWTTPCGLPT